METEETVYCVVLDSKKDIKLSPPPLPKRNENISVSLLEERCLPTRIFRPIDYMTNNSQRCRQTSSSKKKVVLALSITVAIFAILAAVFMTLYFTTEAKCRYCKDSCRSTTHNDVCQNCSSVSNCSSLQNKSHNCACQNCSVVSNISKIKNSTSNNTGKNKC